MSDGLHAQLSDQDLLGREHARPVARRSLPHPASVARRIALAICEVEAGYARPANWSGSATPVSGRQWPIAFSAPAGHRSAAPASCACTSRSSSPA